MNFIFLIRALKKKKKKKTNIIRSRDTPTQGVRGCFFSSLVLHVLLSPVDLIAYKSPMNTCKTLDLRASV